MSSPANPPETEFGAFGPVTRKPLSRIQKLVSAHLTRNWTTIPHVTHHDLADVTGLGRARRRLQATAGISITPLPFLVKAAVAALKTYPQFNAALDPKGEHLILKEYVHIGIAVDTPSGLLVPVIRDADRKGVAEIAAEIAELSEQARSKGLPLERMSGGCFSISSLGAIGGTGFTPIINAPEVAIMGITRSYEAFRRLEGEGQWRTLLPLSLSYDHRVINGADAARFCCAFARALEAPESLT